MARPLNSALFRRALRVLPGGVNSPVRAFKAVGGVPRFVRSAKGARFTDAEGRSYLDYCLSWGPLILGHARREIVAAAARAIRLGTTFGASTEIEIALASAIREAFPAMDLVRLTSSATEAVMSAVRVARARTGRDLIVTFAGAYHGHSDGLLVHAGSGIATLGLPGSAGVPKSFAEKTLSLPYNDLKALQEAFRKYPGQIAAVVVEPVCANMGLVLPRPGFLRGLIAAARAAGALVIFDEVVTGLRLCYGGAQTLFGLSPDLTCLGKIVGGGFPLAAYGGKRRIMELVAPLGPVYQAGTLSGNPVACAAGVACLKALRTPGVYGRLEALTRRLVSGLEEGARAAGVPVSVPTLASMFTVFFRPSAPRDYAQAKEADGRAYARFFHAMLKEGVYLPPSQFETAFLSAAHTRADVDRTVAAARRAFAKARVPRGRALRRG